LSAGVYVTLAVQFPAAQLGVPIAPSVPCVGAVPIAKVSASPFASVPDSVITFAVSSAVVWLCALATGAVFPIATVTVAAAEFNAPSLTLNVKLSDPVKLVVGVYVTEAVQFEPDPLGVQLGVPIDPNVPFVGAVTILKVNAALSMSAPDNVIGNAVFFAVDTDCPFAVGASFTAVIVIDTVPAAEVKLPSLVVNVKLSGPV
jgi:hypothetical protein